MNLFSAWIPAPSQSFLAKLVVLLIGIICAGVRA